MKNEELKEEKKTSTKKTKQTKSGTASKTKKKTTTNTTKKTETKKEPKKEPKKEKIILDEAKDVEIIEKIEPTSKSTNEKVTPASKKGLKTSDWLLIAGLAIVAILGYFMMSGKPEKPSYELPLTLSGEAGLQELSYAEYQEKIDNKESFVVIIERATCSHCVSFLPVAKSFASDNNVPMYYVDTDTFSEEDWNSFEKSNTFLKKNSGKWGTPTTVVLAGNEAVDYIEGETTADKLLDLYQEYFDMESNGKTEANE